MTPLKRFTLLASIFIVCTGLVWWYFAQIDNRTTLATTDVVIRDATFQVQIAQTEQQRRQGLQNVTQMCQTCGMLFLFNEVSQHTFWMRNTPLSLDIIWIRDGEIVEIAQGVVPQNDDLITPKETSDMVLEVHAGEVEKYNITVGDQVFVTQNIQ
jgi:uncharacterized membrane protein (UPF0127 family)